jgi:hypothetical protein
MLSLRKPKGKSLMKGRIQKPESRSQKDKAETREQNSGVRSQESEYKAENHID